MMAIMSFATLVAATLSATGFAVLLAWLTLQAAFHLMQPAARPPVTARTQGSELVHGTVQLVHAYSTHR